jgi:hypothetical protein
MRIHIDPYSLQHVPGRVRIRHVKSNLDPDYEALLCHIKKIGYIVFESCVIFF